MLEVYREGSCHNEEVWCWCTGSWCFNRYLNELKLSWIWVWLFFHNETRFMETNVVPTRYQTYPTLGRMEILTRAKDQTPRKLLNAHNLVRVCDLVSTWNQENLCSHLRVIHILQTVAQKGTGAPRVYFTIDEFDCKVKMKHVAQERTYQMTEKNQTNCQIPECELAGLGQRSSNVFCGGEQLWLRWPSRAYNNALKLSR